MLDSDDVCPYMASNIISLHPTKTIYKPCKVSSVLLCFPRPIDCRLPCLERRSKNADDIYSLLVDHKLKSAWALGFLNSTNLVVDLQAHGVIWNALLLTAHASVQDMYTCRAGLGSQEPFRDVEGSIWLASVLQTVRQRYTKIIALMERPEGSTIGLPTKVRSRWARFLSRFGIAVL